MWVPVSNTNVLETDDRGWEGVAAQAMVRRSRFRSRKIRLLLILFLSLLYEGRISAYRTRDS